MIKTFASNAILSKARAMYGKRLTSKDYQNLLNCSSVPEVLTYLKSHTKYSTLLTGLNERDVHRGQLELILKQQLFYDFASLCRYEISVGEHFSSYIIMRTEIEQILHYLMLYNSKKTNEYIYALPEYFDKHTKIDLHALASARNYDTLLSVLDKTAYRKILEKFKPTNDFIDIPSIENELYIMLYKEIFNIINTYTNGKSKKELLQIFNHDVDLINFVRILRLKKYFHLNYEEIKEKLLPFGTLKEQTIDGMCQAENSSQIFSLMQSTNSGKIINKLEYSFAGDISNKAKFTSAKKNIRHSTSPCVVMMSYIFLEEAELSNVINIIEGIRYGVDDDTVKGLLIF